MILQNPTKIFRPFLVPLIDFKIQQIQSTKLQCCQATAPPPFGSASATTSGGYVAGDHGVHPWKPWEVAQKVHKHQSQMATFHHISIYLLVTLIDFYGIFLHCWVIPFFLLRVSLPFDDHDGQAHPLDSPCPFLPGLRSLGRRGGGLRPEAHGSQDEEWGIGEVPFGIEHDTPSKFNIDTNDTKQWPSDTLQSAKHLRHLKSQFRICELYWASWRIQPIWPTLTNIAKSSTGEHLHNFVYHGLTRSDLLEFQTGKLLTIDFGLEVHGQRHSYHLHSLSVWSSSILLNTAVFLGNFPLLGSPDFGASWGYDCVSAGCFDSLPSNPKFAHVDWKKIGTRDPPEKTTTHDFTPSWVKCVVTCFSIGCLLVDGLLGLTFRLGSAHIQTLWAALAYFSAWFFQQPERTSFCAAESLSFLESPRYTLQSGPSTLD